MTSVVIPAHDEESVIGRCLAALLADAGSGEFQVIVVANGCSDGTARVARQHGDDVVVLERPAAGKTAALNEGDRAATRFPRIYLDADVVLTSSAARAVSAALSTGEHLAAAPRPVVDTSSSCRLVAWHYQLWEQLPVTRDGYVGSGVYAVSEEGHRRIAPFPHLVADDHYVRRRFTRGERTTVSETFTVMAPRTVRAYLTRATRARAGNAALEASRDLDLVEETSHRGVTALLPLLARPWMWPRVAAFASLTAAVRLKLATARQVEGQWGRDSSSR